MTLRTLRNKLLILKLCLILALPLNSQTWIQKTDVPFGGSLFSASFSIGNKGYIVTGISSTGSVTKEVWEYDPGTDKWTKKADFPGNARMGAVSFNIGNKGYLGCGNDNFGNLNDFWEYNPTNDSWLRKADLNGSMRTAAAGFSIGDKGYIGTGHSTSSTNSALKDFWEYNSITDVWTSKADFPGGFRTDAVGFSIGTKGYIGLGRDTSSIRKKDIWEYNPSLNTWLQKADMGTELRSSALAFTIGLKAYVGTGEKSSSYLADFWQYDQNSNVWTNIDDIPGIFDGARGGAVSFVINNHAFAGVGGQINNFQFKSDWYELSFTSSGIADSQKGESYFVFPNPTSGIFHLTNENATLHTNIYIYDQLGKLIYTINIGANEYNISNLDQGIYHLIFEDGSGLGNIILNK
jgi:N-acetylneuraminic acid mutarotase